MPPVPSSTVPLRTTRSKAADKIFYRPFFLRHSAKSVSDFGSVAG
jgi:hypothetical protein